MRMNPTIVPLNAGGNLYALRDDKGQFVGTGTREVCEVLLYILRSCAQEKSTGAGVALLRAKRPNVRAAITI